MGERCFSLKHYTMTTSKHISKYLKYSVFSISMLFLLLTICYIYPGHHTKVDCRELIWEEELFKSELSTWGVTVRKEWLWGRSLFFSEDGDRDLFFFYLEYLLQNFVTWLLLLLSFCNYYCFLFKFIDVIVVL